METETVAYGGQAVVEGVMFGGRHAQVTAIRRKNGEIEMLNKDQQIQAGSFFAGLFQHLGFPRFSSGWRLPGHVVLRTWHLPPPLDHLCTVWVSMKLHLLVGRSWFDDCEMWYTIVRQSSCPLGLGIAGYPVAVSIFAGILWYNGEGIEERKGDGMPKVLVFTDDLNR